MSWHHHHPIQTRAEALRLKLFLRTKPDWQTVQGSLHTLPDVKKGIADADELAVQDRAQTRRCEVVSSSTRAT